MKRIVSASLVLLMLFGLIGLGSSACRELMASSADVQLTPTCHSEACCMVCRLEQVDDPALPEKGSFELKSTPVAFLADNPNSRILTSPPSRNRLPHQPLVLLFGGDVYLLNASFLI